MRGGSGPAAPFGGGALADGVRALAARGARHRRLAAALLAAAAAVAAVPAVTPSAPPPAAVDGPVTGAPRLLGAPGGAFDAGAVGAAGRTVVAVRLSDVAGLLLAAPGRHVEVLAAAAGSGSGAPSDVPAGPADVVAADALVVAVPEPPGPGTPAGAAAGPLTGVLGGSADATDGSAGGLAGVVLLAVPPGDVPRLAGGGARTLSLALPLPAG